MSYLSSASNSSTGAIVEDVERCKDDFPEHCLDGSLETSISDGGAGPQQTQSLVGVHDDGQLSTHPLQSKKQKTEAERCGGSVCASEFGAQYHTVSQYESASGNVRCGPGDGADEDINLAISNRTAESLDDPYASATASAQRAEIARGLETTFASSSSTPIESMALEYTDVFLGRAMRILFNQRTQIEQPLKLIKALCHFFLQSHGPAQSIKRRQPSRFPVDCLHTEFWQVQRVRAIFGCSSQACRRLAMLPSSLNVPVRTTEHWRTRILVRVLSGFYRKIQVRQRWGTFVCAFRLCSRSHHLFY
jgi:hypothetical protein